jgi:hypothetical protein
VAEARAKLRVLTALSTRGRKSMTSGSTLLCLVVASLAVVSSVGTAVSAEGPPWIDQTAEIEDLLRTGAVVQAKPLGEGANHPQRLTLSKNGRTMDGLWKPIERGKKSWAWESFQAEVAAYELDKMLHLNMVPPTVVREVGGVPGSLQLWVEGYRLFEKVEGETPPDPRRFQEQILRMKLFDSLISNGDRNPRNYMVDSDWNIVLIDHSQAFLSTRALSSDSDQLPDRFDRRQVELLRSLGEDHLRFKFGRLLMEPQVEAILARRKSLLTYIDKLIEIRGEDSVLF